MLGGTRKQWRLTTFKVSNEKKRHVARRNMFATSKAKQTALLRGLARCKWVTDSTVTQERADDQPMFCMSAESMSSHVRNLERAKKFAAMKETTEANVDQRHIFCFVLIFSGLDSQAIASCLGSVRSQLSGENNLVPLKLRSARRLEASVH